MKTVIWLLLLAAVAVVLALLVGDNQAIVSVFWPPWRIDLSLNLVLIGAVAGFVLLYFALRGIALLRALPRRAQRWRTQQQERAVYVNLLDAWVYQLSGRFVRAQTAAQHALHLLERLPEGALAHPARWRVLARLLQAESAHSLGQAAQRDAVIEAAVAEHHSDAAPVREAALLRAAAWAIKARDTAQAQHWWQQLPQGAARRIQAVRLRLKLAQLERDSASAIDMVRLLNKHKAITPTAAASVLHSLVHEALRQTHDSEQLLRVWKGLDAKERHDPVLALEFLEQWVRVWPAATAQPPEAQSEPPPELQAQSAALLVRPGREALRLRDEALQGLWAAYAQLERNLQHRCVRVLQALLPALDARWLGQLEAAQQARPADPGLQYLTGQALLQRQLWGKATQLLQQASRSLPDPVLQRSAWCALARLAEQRGDADAAQQAWKQAALCGVHEP